MVKARQRADGRKEIRETIDGERRSFYGKTNKVVRQKYREARAAPSSNDKPAVEPVSITVRELSRQYDKIARDTFSRASQVNPRTSYTPRGETTSTAMAKPMSNTVSLRGRMPRRSQVIRKFI